MRKEHFHGAVFGLALGGLIMVALGVTGEPPADLKPSMPLSVCERIMPTDLGEKVIIWLHENGEGGYSLDWEKHQVVTFGMASVPVGVDSVPGSKH